MTQTAQPAENTVAGAEAVQYLREQGLDERPLRIKRVVKTDKYREYDITHTLHFSNTDNVMGVNWVLAGILTAAFGEERRHWRNRWVRPFPIQRMSIHDNPVWTVELQPLWRCRACRKEFATNAATRVCGWCSYGEEK